MSIFKDISETYHCVGINIKADSGDNLPYTLIECNGNDMSIFNDESFNAITCNAFFKHDKFFWRTIAEVKKVLKPGGLVYVGGSGNSNQNNLVQKTLLRVVRSARLRSVPLLYRLAQ